jgi:hypothetical protein
MLNNSFVVEKPPNQFESMKYFRTLTNYLTEVKTDGQQTQMPPKAIEWGQTMLVAGILMGQLD